MAFPSKFDPYHKWLGIPADEQPANHYRLLRINRFESDAEVIENAYDKEMADLKAQEHGQHAEFVDQLSRELIAAHTCLLDAQKKTAYDEELREELRTKAVAESFAVEQLQRANVDEAVRTATAGLLGERNRLTTLADQASARLRQVLLEARQLRGEVEQHGVEDAGAAARLNASGRGVEGESPDVITAPDRGNRSVRQAGRLTILAACLAPFNAMDRLLAKLAGEGNALLHRLLRVLAMFVPVVVLVVVIWLMMGIREEQTNSAKAGGESTEPETTVKPVPAENESPELVALADLTVVVGEEVSMVAKASDSDDEDAALRFSLSGEPIGATIDTITGQFRWTPTETQEGQSYELTVRVQDDGTPPRADEKSCMLTVLFPDIGTQAGQERDDNGLKMKLSWCPPGTFQMGSPPNERGRRSDERLVAVTLTRGFWFGKHEVTQGQWEQVLGTKPWKSNSYVKEGADYPVTYVSWNDGMNFCRKLTEQERQAGRLSADWEYALPTEAQWEYACRAGSTTRYSFGDDDTRLGEFAWIRKNTERVNEGYAHQVGRKKPNSWGLHDTHGNCWEWCRDHAVGGRPGGTDPEVTGDSSARVIRGGSWYDDTPSWRSARRHYFATGYKRPFLSFRVVRRPVTAANAVPPAETAPLVGTRPGEERADNDLKMKFCWCPPGKFTMGSPTDEPGRIRSREDQIAVTLTRGFWLGKSEVTQDQWVQVIGTKPWEGKSYVKKGADFPATYVNWDDTMEFCRKLTEQERRAGRLPTDWQYTLPTEAQWEYACRAGSTTRFSFGENESQLGEFAWFRKNAFSLGKRYAHQVGVKKPNAWGLHDMHGNVYEWCRDWYEGKLPGGTNPEVTSGGTYRVNRGGSWDYWPGNCRSAGRNYFDPLNRNFSLGFRVARSSVE